MQDLKENSRVSFSNRLHLSAFINHQFFSMPDFLSCITVNLIKITSCLYINNFSMFAAAKI